MSSQEGKLKPRALLVSANDEFKAQYNKYLRWAAAIAVTLTIRSSIEINSWRLM